MNVFVAGGSGTIGKPLVRALIGAGHLDGGRTADVSRGAV